jgi:hypothetical protein
MTAKPMSKGVLILGSLAALATAQPAPDWLRNAAVVTNWKDREHGTVDEGRLAGIPLLINVQQKAWIDDAHRKGFRGISYTSCMDMYIEPSPGRAGGRMLLSNDTANSLLIDKDGRFVDTLMDGTRRFNRKLVCTNSTTYVEKMMQYLKSVMDQGMDGLFVDNVSESRVECYGHGFRVGYSNWYKTVIAESPAVNFRDPRLADVPVHTHLYPDQNHSYAFRQLLLKIRKMVKTYSPERVMVINGGLPFADCADATMIESYVCSWAWKGRRRNWTQLKDLAAEYAPYIRSGGAVIALSYFGETQTTVKDDAFFSYAAARLSDFIWSDYQTLNGDPATVLYRANLGPPASSLQTAKPGVEYRWYRHGLIVINATDRQQAAVLNAPQGSAFRSLADLYDGGDIPVAVGRVVLSVPAQSGRVYDGR